MVTYVVAVAILLNAELGAIGRCEQDDGSVLFTNLGCPDGSVAQQATTSAPHSYVDMALPEIRHPREVRSGQRNRTSRRRADPSVEESKAHCDAARADLAALRAARRKGYRLDDAADLDQREAALKSQRRRFC